MKYKFCLIFVLLFFAQITYTQSVTFEISGGAGYSPIHFDRSLMENDHFSHYGGNTIYFGTGIDYSIDDNWGIRIMPGLSNINLKSRHLGFEEVMIDRENFIFTRNYVGLHLPISFRYAFSFAGRESFLTIGSSINYVYLTSVYYAFPLIPELENINVSSNFSEKFLFGLDASFGINPLKSFPRLTAGFKFHYPFGTNHEQFYLLHVVDRLSGEEEFHETRFSMRPVYGLFQLSYNFADHFTRKDAKNKNIRTERTELSDGNYWKLAVSGGIATRNTNHVSAYPDFMGSYSEKIGRGFHIDGLRNIQFNRNWRIATGLSFSNLTFNGALVTPWEKVQDLFEDFTDEEKEEIKQFFPYTYRKSHRESYLALPILVSVNSTLDNNLSFHLESGFSLNYFLRSKIVTDIYISTGHYATSYTHVYNFWNHFDTDALELGFVFRTGIERELNRRYNLLIAPELRLYNVGMNRRVHLQYNEGLQPYSISISMGLKFN